MLTAKLILERLDQNQRFLERREQQSRSFVRQFIQTLYLQHAQIQTGGYSIIDHTNTSRSVDADGAAPGWYGKSNLRVGAPPGNAMLLGSTGNYYGTIAQHLACQVESQYAGIQVGTGINVVAPTNISLQTRVSHGRSVGQLEYGGCELLNLIFSNPNGSFDIRRYFTNLSGGSITVNEIGIYGLITRGDPTANQGVWAACFTRDLVSPGVALANTELLRATYTVQIMV